MSEVVSIVVPAYNVQGLIARCVESILGQTYHLLELIIVDDASTDRTGEILDSLSIRDSRIRVVHLSENCGVHNARAYGIKAAKGEFIGFVDADDWIAPTMIAEMTRELVDSSADIAVCGAVMARATNELRGRKVAFWRRRIIEDEILARFCRLEFGAGVLWNKLYRADLIRRFAVMALERAVDAAEDYIVNIGCFANASRVVTLPGYLYYYCDRKESASRSAEIAKRFSRTLRAYAISLEIYASSLRNELHLIDSLYARQLSLDAYRLEDPTRLLAFDEHVRESLNRLAAVHPTGIYSLIHACDLHKSGIGNSVRNVMLRWMKSSNGIVSGVLEGGCNKTVRSLITKLRW